MMRCSVEGECRRWLRSVIVGVAAAAAGGMLLREQNELPAFAITLLNAAANGSEKEAPAYNWSQDLQSWTAKRRQRKERDNRNCCRLSSRETETAWILGLVDFLHFGNLFLLSLLWRPDGAPRARVLLRHPHGSKLLRGREGINITNLALQLHVTRGAVFVRCSLC